MASPKTRLPLILVGILSVASIILSSMIFNLKPMASENADLREERILPEESVLEITERPSMSENSQTMEGAANAQTKDLAAMEEAARQLAEQITSKEASAEVVSTTDGLSAEKKQITSQSLKPEEDLDTTEQESSTRTDYAVSSSVEEKSTDVQTADQTQQQENAAEQTAVSSGETETVEEASVSQEGSQSDETSLQTEDSVQEASSGDVTEAAEGTTETPETPSEESAEAPAQESSQNTEEASSETTTEESSEPASGTSEEETQEQPAQEAEAQESQEGEQETASTEENPGTTDRGQETSGGSTTGGYTDLDYLAALCQIEAGPYYDGSLAVANCVLNRLYAGFGSSIYEIIYAPYQFACGNIMYLLDTGSVSSVCYEAAQDALNGVNNIGGYLYFNGTTWLDPSTLDCPYVVIGGNCFY